MTSPDRRVLVIDDDARIADLVATMLQTLGYTATVALTGDEALRIVGSMPPDLVLLDMTMPGIAGAELLDALLQSSPQTPVVVMTGDPARADGMLQRGAIGYLAKPFRVEALNEKLREILR
jgi:CheY-like chemotaxis protein